MENPNKFIKAAVKSKYNIDFDTCPKEDLLRVEEILVKGVTRDDKFNNWDFSAFPNLKKVDCSSNPISMLNVSQNLHLEDITWGPVIGDFVHKLAFPLNPNLRRVSGGQDGLIELDLSSNPNIEEVEIWLNTYMRWIDLDSCTKLKKIRLKGVNIPFVDLTHCTQLEYVEIDYLNLYSRQCGEFGPGYPRPIVFVNSDFNEKIIPIDTRCHKSYTYFLVVVHPGSEEESYLQNLKNRKEEFLSIPYNRYGSYVAYKHYDLLEELERLPKPMVYAKEVEDDDLSFFR